ncbi:MAG: NifU family protein [Bacteroidia bacterium]|nr:NifU family protein [Bacteroidia bacterium]
MITVYSESTPNPSAMKFVASSMLLEDGIEEYFNAGETGNCKLAARLFEYPFVKSVFITANFLSVHKTEDIEWFEVHNEIRQLVSDFLNNGEELFIGREVKNAVKEEMPRIKEPSAAANESDSIPGSMDEQITHLLNEYVRPAVESDGGAIQFKSYDEGKVTVTLRGACSGCPSSSLTLKSGIETLLKQMLPGKITEVVAEEL